MNDFSEQHEGVTLAIARPFHQLTKCVGLMAMLSTVVQITSLNFLSYLLS